MHEAFPKSRYFDKSMSNPWQWRVVAGIGRIKLMVCFIAGIRNWPGFAIMPSAEHVALIADSLMTLQKPLEPLYRQRCY